ncbi:GIY-YIG nuclease family protein [Echinicola sp. 20G]|uniref:GIY-YIG nuclease family protein n=1 Tax=Echinicola sp. 20G TaxID=2781961 RepID=UPI00191046BD|nr:GIY-YIG nuclease family protein [Echinicola sp. 20G]
MSNFCVYILYSPSIDTFYIGYTQDLIHRLSQHNEHVFSGSFTHRASDWEVYFSLGCKSKRQAHEIERYIKRNKSRKYLENLKHFPAISEKLLSKYAD